MSDTSDFRLIILILSLLLNFAISLEEKFKYFNDGGRTDSDIISFISEIRFRCYIIYSASPAFFFNCSVAAFIFLI